MGRGGNRPTQPNTPNYLSYAHANCSHEMELSNCELLFFWKGGDEGGGGLPGGGGGGRERKGSGGRGVKSNKILRQDSREPARSPPRSPSNLLVSFPA